MAKIEEKKHKEVKYGSYRVIQEPKDAPTEAEDTASQKIIETWKTERTAWTVDDMVDFTTAEPALIPENYGKRYMNTVTGKGSTSTLLDFHEGDLYEIGLDGTWHEYEPKESWTLSHKEHNWNWYDGAWHMQPGSNHTHSSVTDGTTTYGVRDGNWGRIRVR